VGHALHDDEGIATPVEMMYLLVFCIVAVVFLGYLGRLHAAGVQVTNASQAAARAASLAATPDAARRAAEEAVALSALPARCIEPAAVAVEWAPSPAGTWQGGSVTVAVTCHVRNQVLTGLWTPGVRTVRVSDTQPVDRYRR